MADKIRVAVNGYGVIGRRVADAVTAQTDMELVGVADVKMSEGLTAINAVKELMIELGRSRENLYEVALWEDLVEVKGDEVFYAYMVDNQAIVIPETIDAIRALDGRVKTARASIEMTDSALGVRSRFV